MKTSAEQIRAWTGPAVLSFGFRPFFLLAGIWATVAMVLWIFMLVEREPLPMAFDPFAWHAHEFVFGYLSAVIAGFLLTAVPNWTGRLPIVGWPLAGLVALWCLGRAAVAIAGWLPWVIVLMADIAMTLVLGLVLAREILAGRNWRNLPVLGLLTLFVVANTVFHAEAAAGRAASDGYGLRLGLAAVLMLIALVGGRIIPSFTRNWLAARKAVRLPIPFGRPDGVVLGLTGVALAGFVLWPEAVMTAVLCMIAGVANLWRLSRWQGIQTRAEALLWVLHVAYAFLALGFLTVGAAGLGLLPQAGARHVWLAGAIGLMTLGVMSRASLGHAGRPLHAGKWLSAAYLALIAAAITRFAAGLMPGEAWMVHLSAALWIAGFGTFAVLYWPILTRPKLTAKRLSGTARRA